LAATSIRSAIVVDPVAASWAAKAVLLSIGPPLAPRGGRFYVS
jgi:hypothetical protein